MTRVFPPPGQAPPAQPGTHALVIGVSAYRYLTGGPNAEPESYGMRQLTSAANSALKVYEWLLANRDRLAPPLATCRLLLSPAPGELANAPAVDAATTAYALAEIDGWRQDARGHRDGAAFFYFAGHGIQRGERDAVVLLSDFNDPVGGRLRNAIDTGTLFDGMSPSQDGNAEIARNQMYCVDACRIEPDQFARLRHQTTAQCFALSVGAMAVSDRSAPFLYGALPGAVAEALPDKQTLFSMALLRALDSAVDEVDLSTGVARWPVTTFRLVDALADEIEQLRREHGGTFDFLVEGQLRDAVIRYLDAPPEVDVTIQVEPANAAVVGSVEIRDEEDNLFGAKRGPPVVPHPVRLKLPVGHYRIIVDFQPPVAPFHARRLIKRATRRSVWPVRVV